MSEAKEHPGRWPVNEKYVRDFISDPDQCESEQFIYDEIIEVRDYILQLEKERDEQAANILILEKERDEWKRLCKTYFQAMYDALKEREAGSEICGGHGEERREQLDEVVGQAGGVGPSASPGGAGYSGGGSAARRGAGGH